MFNNWDIKGTIFFINISSSQSSQIIIIITIIMSSRT